MLQVSGRVLLPATGMLEPFSTALASVASPAQGCMVHKTAILTPLIIQAQNSTTMELQLSLQTGSLELSSYGDLLHRNGANSASMHCRAFGGTGPSPALHGGKSPTPEGLWNPATPAGSGATLMESSKVCNLLFATLGSLEGSQTPGTACALASLPPTRNDGFTVNPATLDNLLQSATALRSGGGQATPKVPVGLNALVMQQPQPGHCRFYASAWSEARPLLPDALASYKLNSHATHTACQLSGLLTKKMGMPSSHHA